MMDTKSTRLNLDIKQGNQIELIDNDMITTNSVVTKKILRLEKKKPDTIKIENYNLTGLAGHPTEIQNKPNPSKPTINIIECSPENMYEDLELIGNEETKNQLAEMFNNNNNQNKNSHQNSQNLEIEVKNKSSQLGPEKTNIDHPQIQINGSPNVSDIKHSDSRSQYSNHSQTHIILSKEKKKSEKRVPVDNTSDLTPIEPPHISHPIEIPDQSKKSNELKIDNDTIKKFNRHLDQIPEKLDPDVRSDNSSKILDFTPAFSTGSLKEEKKKQ